MYDTDYNIIGTFIFGIFTIIIVTFFAINGIAQHSCNTLGSKTSREVNYSFWSGCLIKVNNQFIPSDNWIVNSGN